MVFPSKHSRGVTVWPRAQHTTVTEKQLTSSFSNRDKEDHMWFLSPVLWSAASKHSYIWTVRSYRSTVDVQLVVSFFFVAALGRINNCMQARIPLSQHSFILGRYHHPMFVWKCFCQQVIFCVSKTALVLSTCTQIFPYSEGKYFFFSFFLNLHCLSFLIHVRSLTEVTTTQSGVRRVVLQGIPERVILLMGS